jgi:hypothetical protein
MRSMLVRPIPDVGGRSTIIGIVVPLRLSVCPCPFFIFATQIKWDRSMDCLNPRGYVMDSVYCSSD